MYKPETQGALPGLFHKVQRYKVQPGSNPVEVLHELEAIRDTLQENGGVNLDERFLLSRLLDALPPEYEIAQQTLASRETLTRGDIVRVVGTQFTSLCNKKAAAAEVQKPQQAFIVNDGGGGGKARQAGRGGGGKGRGRGNGNQNSADGGPGSSNSSEGAGKDNRRCFRCNRRGHIEPNCTTKACDFLHQCDNCSGFDHKESEYLSETAVLAFEIDEEHLTVKVAAF